MLVASLVGVCMQLVAATHVPAQFIATNAFTLAWTHTIEKVRWEEDYEVLQTPHGPLMRATKARIKGSAAGMEPPAHAVLVNGWYQYESDKQLTELRLTRSEFSPDYQWCDQQGCRPLSALMPNDGLVTVLTACTAPTHL